jgi:hypothetical protein
MNRPAKIFSAFLISVVIMACSIADIPAPVPDQQNVVTIVASTIQAITAAAPASTPLAPTSLPPIQTSGILISFKNVSLVIPNGLASGAAGEQAAEVNANSGAPWEVAPAHVKLTFKGYPLQGTLWEPSLHFYPANQFSTMDDGAAQIITKLKSVISNPTSLPDHLPFLPMVNANQMFYAQAKIIQFKNGTGIRYITQFDQAYLPINNHDLFYTFQGLTGDGSYYISLTLPVNSPVLPADNNPNSPVPSGGVAFDQNDFSKFPLYISDLTGILNSASSDSFTPSLSTMDELVKSIAVNP